MLTRLCHCLYLNRRQDPAFGVPSSRSTSLSWLSLSYVFSAPFNMFLLPSLCPIPRHLRLPFIVTHSTWSEAHGVLRCLRHVTLSLHFVNLPFHHIARTLCIKISRLLLFSTPLFQHSETNLPHSRVHRNFPIPLLRRIPYHLFILHSRLPFHHSVRRCLWYLVLITSLFPYCRLFLQHHPLLAPIVSSPILHSYIELFHNILLTSPSLPPFSYPMFRLLPFHDRLYSFTANYGLLRHRNVQLNPATLVYLRHDPFFASTTFTVFTTYSSLLSIPPFHSLFFSRFRLIGLLLSSPANFLSFIHMNSLFSITSSRHLGNSHAFSTQVLSFHKTHLTLKRVPRLSLF